MRIIVTAGGTGGHIYPALAIIEKFQEKESNLEIKYIGTHNRMEKNIVPALNIDYTSLEIYGFNFRTITRNFKNLFLIHQAKKKCQKIMQDFKPDVIIGTGGYVTYPVISVAKKLGIPIFLHEQNSIPGKTNTILAKNIDLVGVSFKDSKIYFKKAKRVEFTGNPRGEKAYKASALDIQTIGFNPYQKFVVYVAGSLGSMSMNTKMKEFLHSIGDEKYQLLYITGKDYYDEFIQNEKFPSNVKIMPYMDNLINALAAADLIISRAGATIISEIAALEKPAIYIPSPYVANNHQYYNALELKNKKAGELIEEKNLTSEILKATIRNIVFNKNTYQTMKNNLKTLGIKDSSQRIYNLIKDVLK